MRHGFLLFFALALPLPACGSDEPAATTNSGPNACVAAGGRCQPNAPFMCAPGYEPSSKATLNSACGTAENLGGTPSTIPCCFVEATPPDTGTKDSAGDAPGDATGDATDDAGGDAGSTDSASTDAIGDAVADAVAEATLDGG